MTNNADWLQSTIHYLQDAEEMVVDTNMQSAMIDIGGKDYTVLAAIRMVKTELTTQFRSIVEHAAALDEEERLAQEDLAETERSLDSWLKGEGNLSHD